MPASDYLKSARSSGYESDAALGKGNDRDEPNSTPRVIKLSEEEVKSLEPYSIKPGEEVILEVHGSLDGDRFRVMRVQYAEGKGEEPEAMGNMGDMAKNVATMVRPQISPSPS